MTTVTHELVELSELNIDPRVQRKEGVHAGRAKQIAKDHNPAALGTLTLSRRPDGELVILDGAHRAEASRIAGYAEPLHALVYEGLTLAQEAAMFNLLNTFRQPSYISRMLAQVVSGDPDATAIIGIIERHGWTVSTDSSNGSFAAVQAAERVYRNAAGALPAGAHPEVLDATMATITGAWRHDRESVHQMVVMGIGQIYGRFGPVVDKTALTTRLSQERPNNIIGLARSFQSAQGGTTAAALAKVVVGVYNRKRRTNLLPEWVWTR